MALITGKNSLFASALAAIGASDAVTVDFDKKTATVTFDPDQTTNEALTKATMNAGYPSTVQK